MLSKKLSLILILFFYIYSVQFIFIPGAIGTRVLLGLLGICVFFYRNIVNNHFYLNSTIIKYFLSLAVIPLISIIAIIANGTTDLSFIKYFFSLTIIFFSAYFVQYWFKKYGEYSLYRLIDYISIVVVIQICLSVLMFLIIPLKEFLLSVQVLSELDKNKILWNGGIRLIGFGSTFFGAGIVNGFTLILLTYKLMNQDLPFKKFLSYLLIFSLILIGGIVMSRTTLIGFSICMLLFLHRKYKLVISYKSIYLFKGVLFIGFIFIILSNIFFIAYEDEFSMLFDYGFELFENYHEEGELSSSSTDEMFEMYKVYPDNLKTLLIGDGFFLDPNGYGYYKQIDIGYYRLVFYFGIIGLLAYLYFQYAIVKLSVNSFHEGKKLFHICFFFLLLLNFKGFSDIVFLLLPFCFNNFGFVHKEINDEEN